jgi:hypothetical protein
MTMSASYMSMSCKRRNETRVSISHSCIMDRARIDNQHSLCGVYARCCMMYKQEHQGRGNVKLSHHSTQLHSKIAVSYVPTAQPIATRSPLLKKVHEVTRDYFRQLQCKQSTYDNLCNHSISNTATNSYYCATLPTEQRHPTYPSAVARINYKYSEVSKKSKLLVAGKES